MNEAPEEEKTTAAHSWIPCSGGQQEEEQEFKVIICYSECEADMSLTCMRPSSKTK